MYRIDLETLRSTPQQNNSTLPISILNEAEENFNVQKIKYEQLKEDVRVSLL